MKSKTYDFFRNTYFWDKFRPEVSWGVRNYVEIRVGHAVDKTNFDTLVPPHTRQPFIHLDKMWRTK